MREKRHTVMSFPQRFALNEKKKNKSILKSAGIKGKKRKENNAFFPLTPLPISLRFSSHSSSSSVAVSPASSPSPLSLQQQLRLRLTRCYSRSSQWSLLAARWCCSSPSSLSISLSLLLWDARTLELIKTYVIERPVNDVAMSPFLYGSCFKLELHEVIWFIEDKKRWLCTTASSRNRYFLLCYFKLQISPLGGWIFFNFVIHG